MDNSPNPPSRRPSRLCKITRDAVDKRGKDCVKTFATIGNWELGIIMAWMRRSDYAQPVRLHLKHWIEARGSR